MEKTTEGIGLMAISKDKIRIKELIKQIYFCLLSKYILD